MKNQPPHDVGNLGGEPNTVHCTGAGLKPGDNRWRVQVWLRPSAADILPDRMLGSLPFRPMQADSQVSDGKGVQQISPLKYRRLTPIIKGETVPGDRRLPEGIPGGRLFKGLPHGRDAV
jgi:hypothetical protein